MTHRKKRRKSRIGCLSISIVDIPLHYVRFHPDYQYRHAERTSIPFLEQARQQALK